MKLTEALSPLFESFKELRAYLEMAEEQGEIAKSSRLRTIYRLLNSTIVLDPSIPSGRLDARGLNDLFRWAMQHPKLPSQMKPTAQTGKIIKLIRSEGMDSALLVLEMFMSSILTELDNPSKQKPEITKVVSGSGWDAYQLHNYAAAREVCNRYGSNFCIGSSKSSWFDRYGTERGRDTFAIITNNKPVIVHSGDNGFLVTSSDNDSDINEKGEGRGRKNKGILEDFSDPETAIEAIQSVVHRKFYPNVESVFGNGPYRNQLFVVEEVSVVEFNNADGSGVSFHDIMGSLAVFFDERRNLMVSGLGYNRERVFPSQAWGLMKMFLRENKFSNLEEEVYISEKIFSKLTTLDMNPDVRIIGGKLLNEVQKEIRRMG